MTEQHKHRPASSILDLPSAREAKTSDKPPPIAWTPPRPLPDHPLMPVARFDVDLLPRSLQAWAQDIAMRMQCPLDFVGVVVMAALGTVIGRRVGVRPKMHDDWTEYPNQWCMVIGRPGVLKTPAIDAALKPLKALDARMNERFEEELAAHQTRATIINMRRSAEEARIKKDLAKNPEAHVIPREFVDEEAPVQRRFLVNDATVEKLGEIHATNPQGIGVHRDELVSLFRSLDREGQEGSRGFYLTGWSGNQPYAVDRISRAPVRIPAVCLSVIGSTQPGRIIEYLREATIGGAGDDGLMQRFGLLVWPDIERASWLDVDRVPDVQAQHEAFAVFDRLALASALHDWKAEPVHDHHGDIDESRPPYLRLDEDAHTLFLRWRIDLENELRAAVLPTVLEAHFSKYRKLVPALALICHLADGGRGPINTSAMRRAIAWATYLRTHAERAYGKCLVTPHERAGALLKKLSLDPKYSNRSFSLRDLYRPQWALLAAQEDVHSAIEVLIDHGYIVKLEPTAAEIVAAQQGGRPKQSRYLLNPLGTHEI